MNYPPPQPQPPLQPVKTKGSGCLLAVGIVAALLGLGVVIVGVVVWRTAHSPAGQNLVENAAIMMEATKAPGAAELKALGCSQALVIDAERMAAANEAWLDDSGPRSGALRNVKRTVVCQINKHSPALTCDAVAAAYRSAVGTPAGSFSVTVTSTRDGNTCSELFAADGTKLGDLSGSVVK